MYFPMIQLMFSMLVNFDVPVAENVANVEQVSVRLIHNLFIFLSSSPDWGS